MRPRSKNHPLGAHPPAYWTNSYSTFIVSTIIDLKLVDIHGTSFLCVSYKVPPSINNISTCASFFSLFLCFIFIAHFFVGLREPRKYFFQTLFMHSLCSPITHSFLDGFQPNLFQHFSHPSSTCHTIFSLK